MASIDGLVSGMDTTTIINQLMALERAPQTNLQTQKTTAQKTIDALRVLNGLMLNVRAAAEGLTTGTLGVTKWAATTATSSLPTSVSATSVSGAPAASLSFTVDQLASGGVSASSGTVAARTTVVAAPGSQLRLVKGTTETLVDVGDGTLDSVVAALNASGAGVSATAVQSSPGQFKLHLASTTTGAATTLSLTLPADPVTGVVPPDDPFAGSTLGAVTTLAAGKDALLQVGGALGYTITRATNTVDDLLKGVTIKLLKADPAAAVQVDVTADSAATADGVNKLVQATNDALAEIGRLTAYDPATKKAGLLVGDGMLRALRQRLLGAVSSGGNADIGVTTTRNGQVTFDRDAFLKALAADPAAVQAALGGTVAAPGAGERLRAIADGAARSASAEGGAGQIGMAMQSKERAITGMTAQIASWDTRLSLREMTLKRKFAALEKALGSSQQQGQWLAGQIAGLPKWS